MILISNVTITSIMKKPSILRHLGMGHFIIRSIEHKRKIRSPLSKDNCKVMMEVAMFGDFLIKMVLKNSTGSSKMALITKCLINRPE